MNSQPCNVHHAEMYAHGSCILCGQPEHYYCADEFHRCGDGGGAGEALRYNPALEARTAKR